MSISVVRLRAKGKSISMGDISPGESSVKFEFRLKSLHWLGHIYGKSILQTKIYLNRGLNALRKFRGFYRWKAKPRLPWIPGGNLYIGLIGLSRKDSVLVFSMDLSLLDLLLCCSFYNSTLRLDQTFSVDWLVLNLSQYTRSYRLCSSKGVSMQLFHR